MWLFANLSEKILKTIETELDAFVVKVLCESAVRIVADRLLSLIRVVGSRLARDPALTMLDCCSTRGPVPAAA